MFAKYYKLILLFLVVGICLYLVVLNRDAVTLKLSEQWMFSASAGVIFIAIFAAGILAAATVALLFGIKARFREMKWEKKDKTNRLFLHTLSEARKALVCGDLDKALHLWENISSKDPSNALAIIELSKCYELKGNHREALKLIDSARALSPENTEILFRSAELNLLQGNKTAAIDNLSMAWFKSSSARAAEMARDISEELGRFDDALEFHAHLAEVAPDKASPALALRLRFGKLLKDSNGPLSTHIESFIKEHGDFPPALAELARLKAESSQTAEAAALYARAAAASGDHLFFHKATDLWLTLGEAEKALASARSALKTAGRDDHRLKCALKLDLLSLELSLNMTESSAELIKELEAEFSAFGKAELAMQERFLVLKALSEANRSGQVKTASLLEDLLRIQTARETPACLHKAVA